MCKAQLFLQEVDHFALKFYLDRVVPSNHFWRHETIDTGLPDCKDFIPLHSLIFTQYRRVMDTQMADGFAVAYTMLAQLCFVEC